MSVIASFTLRSLARNRARTVVSVVGVALSVALLTAVFTTVTSLDALLLDRVVDSEGSWQVFDTATEPGWEDALANDDRVALAMSSGELGSAAIYAKDRQESPLLAVRTMPRAIVGTPDEVRGLSVMPEVTKGREPQAPGEVMLPAYLEGATLGSAEDGRPYARADGPVALGSTITLPVGQRVADDGMELFSAVDDYSYASRVTVAAGGVADMSAEVSLDAGQGDAVGDGERLEDVVEREFVVVGFHEDQLYPRNDFAACESSASCALVWEGEDGVRNSLVWVSTQGLATRAEVKALAEPVFGYEDYYLHSQLLSYQGLGNGRPVWDSLWALAWVLAASVILAAVSLIHGSFALSVADRTRQMGLLASLGATRAQLARSVLVEALAVGAVGIPLGITAGLGGLAAALSATGEAFGYLLYDSMADGTRVPVLASPPVLALVAALSLVVTVASAVHPALRATRVSAVDALRQTQDVRLDRATTHRLWLAQVTGRTQVPPRGFLERLLGTPGMLARRNLSRATSGGRVVVTSLAVSVALIVSSGSVRSLLSPLVALSASNGGAASGADVVANLWCAWDPLEAGGIDLERHTTTLEAALARNGALSEEFAFLRGSVAYTMPAGIADASAYRDLLLAGYAGSDEWDTGIDQTGAGRGAGVAYYVDDATWVELARQARVGTRTARAALDGMNGEHVPALLVNSLMGMDDGGGYLSIRPFSGTGAITAWRVEEREGYVANSPACDGRVGSVVPFWPEEGGDDTKPLLVPIEDAAVSSTELEVVGLLDVMPAMLSVDDALWEFPVIVLPRSCAGTSPALEDVPWATVGLSIQDPEVTPMEAEETVLETVNGIADETLLRECSVAIDNLAQQSHVSRAVYDLINLFVLLYCSTTTLIAVANAFNTLSSSILLRRREFAVLRSCGMGRRDMRRMLLVECLHYALHGMVLGLLLSGVVCGAMWAVLQGGLGGAEMLPVAWVGVAAATVAVVLAASVAHALRRDEGTGVVEAMRG